MHVAETAVEPVGPVFRRPWTAAIDRAVGAVIEPLAALLVLVEIVILAAGVFTRYVLGNPLVWSDELATIILLWLAMLGSVVAYRRSEHINLSVLVRRASPRVRRVLETISSVVTVLFVIELMPASIKFFNQEQIDVTPALGIPQSYVVLAVIVGLALIMVLALLRLVEGDPKVVAGVVAAAVVISAVAWFSRGAFAGLGNFNLVLFFVVLVGACVAIGVPIAFAFGLGTLSYILIVTSTHADIVVGRMQEGVSNLVLLAVPLFIFLGLLMETAGIAARLVGFLASVVGHFRGGLNIVLVGAMYLVSGISGSKIADMAAVAPVLFPDMERRGQKRPQMIALLATSGAMAETIPPSLVLIIIGSVTGVSIQAMFTAGLLPAFIISIFLIAVALWEAHRENATMAPRAPMKTIGLAFVVAIPGLLLPLLIRYFVVAGIATATEVSVVGIIYTLLVGVLIYRAVRLEDVLPHAHRDGLAGGSDPADHCDRDGDGLGAHAVRLRAAAGRHSGPRTGRPSRHHAALDPDVHHPRLRARGHPGDGAVRSAAVPGGQSRGDQRGALRDRRRARDGRRAVLPAGRHRLLRGERDREDAAGARRAPVDAVLHRADRRPAARRVRAVDLARILAEERRTVKDHEDVPHRDDSG